MKFDVQSLFELAVLRPASMPWDAHAASANTKHTAVGAGGTCLQ
jgi:hypothetical protein